MVIFSFPMPLGSGMKKENEIYEPHSGSKNERNGHLRERERMSKMTHSIGNHPEVVSAKSVTVFCNKNHPKVVLEL